MVRPLFEVFSELPDFRKRKGRRHEIAQVLTVVILGLLSGQDNPRQIARWVRGLSPEERTRLKLWRRQAPSESTIRRVLRRVNVRLLSAKLNAWVEEVARAWGWAGKLPGTSVDGKMLRGTRDAEGAVIQVLQATLHRVGTVLRLEVIPQGTNELGVIHAFLEHLILEGKVVTLDALFTHRDVAEQIDAAGGFYVMRVKENQPQLWEALRLWFEQPDPLPETQRHHSVVKGHGRLVYYTIWTTEALTPYLQTELGWTTVRQAGCILRTCRDLATGAITRERHYVITNLPSALAAPQQLLAYWRHHWDNENKVNWVRDVTFGEDRARIRKGGAPIVLALLRSLTITLIRMAGFSFVTDGRAALAANFDQACSIVGLPLE